MEFFNSGSHADITLNREEGDMEAMYNILAYYRLSRGHTRELARGDHNAIMCEKLFQDVRKALEE